MLMRVHGKGQSSVVVGCPSCALILPPFSLWCFRDYEPGKGDWDLTNDEMMIR